MFSSNIFKIDKKTAELFSIVNLFKVPLISFLILSSFPVSLFKNVVFLVFGTL